MWFIACIFSLACLICMIVAVGLINEKLDSIEDALRQFDLILRASDIDMMEFVEPTSVNTYESHSVLD